MSARPGDRAHRVPVAVLAAAFLFNLGQGFLRPSLPLYLQRSFAASYRMVTLIPVVFGAGKWIASLPTGYLLARFGRTLMVWGLLLIALIDLASVMASTYGVFLGLRAMGGVGWAMFATVATTAMVSGPSKKRRGQAVSLLLMSETGGLLLGSAASGWAYQRLGAASPFLIEAVCMLAAAVTVAWWASRAVRPSAVPRASRDRRLLTAVLRTPGLLLMGAISATLIAIQTGALVFLFPLYLVSRGGLGPEAVGILVSLSVLGRLLALWIGGRLSDRWGRIRVLIPGLLAYAALLGGLTLMTQPVMLGLWSLGIGAAAGFVAALPTAVVGDQVPAPLLGVAIGWIRMMTDTGQILGPLLLGALADWVDLSMPFLLGAALLAIAAWRCHREAGSMSTGVSSAWGDR